MATEDYEETNASLARVNRVCKVIAVLLKCVFAVFCVCLLVVFVFLLISSLDQDANATIGEGSIFPPAPFRAGNGLASQGSH